MKRRTTFNCITFVMLLILKSNLIRRKESICLLATKNVIYFYKDNEMGKYSETDVCFVTNMYFRK